MNYKPRTLLFFGPSGAGKGTQSKLLRDMFEKRGESVMYVETGSLLRTFAKEGGYTSKLTTDCISAGGLMPTFIPVYAWAKEFIEHFDGTQHVILDGLARKERGVLTLDGALDFYGRPDYELIVLEIASTTVHERLHLRGREDDLSDEKIQRRIDWYENDVVPAIQKFESLGKAVHRIDGEPSIEAIHNNLLSVLGLEGDSKN